MNKKNVLSAKNLNKIYSKKSSNQIYAINNLNLDVQQGEIFGLLGPNGAGKTTFINILAGTVIKTSGTVNVWGFDLDKNPRQVRASIGIVPQEVNLDAFFSPKKLLDLQAGLYGVKNSQKITETILKLVSLDKQANSYSRNLSGGMKRRLLIAKAMVHQPPILILDEPTAGVDVELRKNLWENVKELNKIGVTIILTTHYLYEAQEMCDRIAIINKGDLVALDTTKKLLREASKKVDVILTCGGVSVGEEDHIKSAVETLGSLEMWKINMKPGKPFAFGTIGKSAFLGMPGNPVSAWVTFALLCRPYLIKLAGGRSFKKNFSILVFSKSTFSCSSCASISLPSVCLFCRDVISSCILFEYLFSSSIDVCSLDTFTFNSLILLAILVKLEIAVSCLAISSIICFIPSFKDTTLPFSYVILSCLKSDAIGCVQVGQLSLSSKKSNVFWCVFKFCSILASSLVS